MLYKNKYYLANRDLEKSYQVSSVKVNNINKTLSKWLSDDQTTSI